MVRNSDAANSMTVMSQAKGACMTVFFFTTLIGNSIVAYIGIKHWSHTRQHITHFLVFNLAIADLVVTLFAMPFEIVEEFLELWLFGNAMCKIVEYIQAVALGASVFIITSIAVDRYICIVTPLMKRLKVRHGKLIVSFCWSFPLLLSIPYIFMYDVEVEIHHEGSNATTLICESHGLPYVWMTKIYWFLEMYFTFLLPLVVMIFCYSKLLRKIMSLKKVGEPSHHASTIHQISPNPVPINNLRRIKNKSVKLTLAFMTVFVICWTPKFVLEVVRLAFGTRAASRRSTIYEIALFMSYVNETMNPVIYAMFDPFFRDKLARLLGKKDNMSGFTTDTLSMPN
ncbi:orexin receptor type 1 isoform X2 [Exaiptasia diaphana]|uniref:G-protein coupled receptors family 1 profile domain-containing protein n=2 Tax=Exaiptasia diaphana TaxID=2652724 RepID=A0A913YK61_EXADI|nr:orexin receptor type 1 isoform X2 [Exaiptasia diaphana]